MRKFKLILSFMIFIGLLGGVGYGIYDAITNQPSEVALSIDGEMRKISEVISDYDRIAEGVTIQLPNSDEDLLAFGISKEGYTFDCWTYDTRGNQIIENGLITKKQGKQTFYLKWKKKDYTVYKIELKDEYAEDFDFKNYGNLTYYQQVANTVDQLAPNIVQFEDYLDLTTYSPEPGYEYTWLKWVGEGECEKDENGVPIYYSIRHQIKEDLTFVRCKMPKKYTVTYKFIDEQNNTQTIGQKELLFKETADTIVRQSDVDYTRVGYEVTGFYITSSINSEAKNIGQTQLIDESILTFVGSEIKGFDCFVTYTPKRYDLIVKGYANKELIYDQTEVAINKTYQVPYYTNILEYLNNILRTTTDLSKNYLIFKNYFTLTDNETNVDSDLRMPAESLEINAHYEIKEYNILFALQLKDQLLILNQKDENQNYINPIRYGMSFDLDTHLYDFDYALSNDASINIVKDNVIISTYYANEYEFSHYTLKTSLDKLEDNSNVIVDNIKNEQELANIAELTRIEQELYVIINTEKVRFFVEFVNKGVDSNRINNPAKWDRCARKEITFMDGIAYFKVPKADEPTQFEMIPTINHQVATPSATGKNSEDAFYTFGGWKCENEAIFGEYAYLDYGYEIEEEIMEKYADDVLVYAEWYETAMKGNNPWKYEISSEENKTITITGYSGSKVNLAIPSSIGGYSVTRIGNGGYNAESGLYYGTKLIAQQAGLKKILIPTSVTSIAPRAFSEEITNVQIRFAETTNENVQDLLIETFAFSPLVNGTSSGISSIYLPKRTKIIQEGAFAYNTNIKNIVISKQNSNYSVVKALDSTGENYSIVLMKNHMAGDVVEKCEIITYCHGATAIDYEIPANVIRIADYAFTQNQNFAKNLTLRKISIAENNILESVGKEGFAYLRRMDSIYLPELKKLNSLSEAIFKESFSYHEEFSNEANLRFQVITFDFNNLTEIPKQMFYNTKYLHGVNLIRSTNIVLVGDLAFNSCGFHYTSSGDHTIYYDKQYVKVREGFVEYLFNEFSVNLTSDGPHNENVLNLSKATQIDNNLFSNMIREYLQVFLVWKSNPLNKVGQNAFTSSVIKVYSNTENFITTYKGQEPYIEFNGFASATIYPFGSFSHRFVNDNLIDLNVQKLVIQDALVGSTSFNKANLYDLGIHFIDCFFAGSSAVGGSHTFQEFTINDTKSNGNFNFTVELTAKAEPDKNEYTIQSNIFNGMNISNSKFVFISNIVIDKQNKIGAILSSNSLMSIKCKEMEITGILSLSGTTFAPAQESNGTLNSESATKITFNNCYFTMTDEQGFRNLMFHELYRLNTVIFNNCPDINAEYIEKAQEFAGIKTRKYPEPRQLRISSSNDIIVLEFGDHE